MASVIPGLPDCPALATEAVTQAAATADAENMQAETSADALSASHSACSTVGAPVESNEWAHRGRSQPPGENARGSSTLRVPDVQDTAQWKAQSPLGGPVSLTTRNRGACRYLDRPAQSIGPEQGGPHSEGAAVPTESGLKGETQTDVSCASSAGCIPSGEPGEDSAKQGEPLDVASLFLSPSEDLDSWTSDGRDLLLPASSFVSADAISQHRGPMSLGRVALFIFGLFQGDVRMGLLSAQGRLLAWRCLLYLAEQHDRQCSGAQAQQQPQQSGGQAAGVTTGDPGMRRRRLQRESVATSKGRRSVRHAFLLDRSGAARGAPAGPTGSGSGFSPGANDEWGEAEEDAAACISVREDSPGELAGEQALSTPGMSLAMSLQRQLQQGAQTIGFEAHFPRFIGGSIDRRWVLQQRSLRIPAETSKGDAEAAPRRDEPLELRLEEFGAATAPKMWPRVEALPEKLFVGLPIQVACWVSWGRTDGGDAGRMLWRDCEIAQVLPGGAFRARCFSSAGEPRQLTCHIRDFVPPRVPVPSPNECAWRLVPMEADPSRDIYPGACLSVCLGVNNQSQQEQQQTEVSRAYFVDVVVQDIYFSVEQTTRARQALAEARDREAAANSSRRTPGSADTGGPLEGLRPNCLVRGMRMMVLRGGGAANEFVAVGGRTIYKLGYDLYAHVGIVKEPSSKHRPGASRFVWAIPRALSPAAPEQVKGASGAALVGGNVEANAKRWQYKTQEESREWVNFPPFLVAYMPYDCAARYTETHPLLLRYLQPELDLSALSCGAWRLCLPQYEYPNVPPVLLPHPSDLPLPDKPTQARAESGEASTEGVMLLENPYARSSGAVGAGPESRCVLTSEDIADSLYASHACEPPQPVGTNQNSLDSGGRASVLGINHLASLLCSGGDSAPPRELLSKALPFFRGLLPHLGSQATDWQLEVARAALRAADQAKELYVDEQETEAEKLRRQGISFGGYLGGTAVAEGGRSQRGTERRGGAVEAESGEAWEWVGNSGSRYPTSSDISRFLLRTSGHGIGVGATRGRGVEGNAAQGEASGGPGGAGRRRALEAVAGMLSGESRRGSVSELGASEGRSRGEDSAFIPRGAGGTEGDFHGTRRPAASASSRAPTDEAVGGSRARGGLSAAALAAGNFGASPATARRRPVVQREEEEDFQPPARATAGSRQSSSGGRAGMARRAARNVSYTALAGMEPGQEDPLFYRPMKRIARSDPHTANPDPSAADTWDHPHSKDAGSEPATSERHVRGSLQQWAALQRQAAAAEERLFSTHGARGSDRGTEASISTDQLHEALKGFVQSIKAGTSPPIVNVSPMARDRSFAASH